MKRTLLAICCLLGALGCSTPPRPQPAAPPHRPAAAPARAAPQLGTGIDARHIDPSVSAREDFYRHVNGRWLATTEIPADKALWGSFMKLADDTQQQLRALIESLGAGADADGRKIAALYRGFMDEAAVDARGWSPLEPLLSKIAAVQRRDELPALFAELAKLEVSVPYVSYVHQDAKDSTRYVFDLYQAGLGLPDRDYYLKDDAKLKDARDKYQRYVEQMLGLVGRKGAAQAAQQILALETALAKAQWTKVQNRDPVKTYNKYALDELGRLGRGYGWQSYLRAAGIEGKVSYLIVSQPSYVSGLIAELRRRPLATWKAYLEWRVLDDMAPYLSRPLVDAHFAFHGTVLRGVPKNEPRWKRAAALVNAALGEALGKLYVAQHFPPRNKARMDQLVANLLAAYRQSIDTLSWMSPATKKKAQAKLAKFAPKIGYPQRWRDYSGLQISGRDLLADISAARAFEYERNVNKLGKPIDRDEWYMTPQTVNAYYNPELNEIVFPAAILQPPFFNVEADEAVNYGGIGAVIGHEISHGFDDQGSQYDGDGNLNTWFTADDLARFKAKGAALVAQYQAYEPLPGQPLNGELTLGENIADCSGLAIAHKAYRLSLAGQAAPVIDGLTGDQRFYMGWAQVWRAKVREAEILRRVKVDPHSPPKFRVVGAVVNQPAFYDAFGVKPGDAMYLPPARRVSIW